jgi:hypothetical protein
LSKGRPFLLHWQLWSRIMAPTVSNAVHHYARHFDHYTQLWSDSRNLLQKVVCHLTVYLVPFNPRSISVKWHTTSGSQHVTTG